MVCEGQGIPGGCQRFHLYVPRYRYRYLSRQPFLGCEERQRDGPWIVQPGCGGCPLTAALPFWRHWLARSHTFHDSPLGWPQTEDSDLAR